jgi:hypothetical protein
MSVLSSFSLPAFIQDFPEGSPQDEELKGRWNINVKAWIQQAMPAPPSYFYDPSTTDIPAGTAAALIHWNAFPGRVRQYFSDAPPTQPANPSKLPAASIYDLVDFGEYQFEGLPGLWSFPNIPTVLCPEVDWQQPQDQWVKFGPYGPRGWLDEYCEWSSARDEKGNLIRVDFACENPEYWNTLWKVSPDRVCELYNEILNAGAPPPQQVTVTLEDLYLMSGGAPVIDPDTGRPAYNPLNRWNSGPTAVRTGDPAQFRGGAIHLTSTPNTLQTELGLASAATNQYPSGNADAQALICCARYGQQYRNSDPHIGQSVNEVVGGQATGGYNTACLADPVGLYIQMPGNPAAFQFAERIDPTKFPQGAQSASGVFQVLRGNPQPLDPVTQSPFDGAMVLHAVCQIPQAWLAVYPDMTLADITINGVPVTWGGQIAEQFDIGLYARPLPMEQQPVPLPNCASSAVTPAQPLQCTHQALWDGYYPQMEDSPTGQSMSLASNTTFIPPYLKANGGAYALVLTCTSYQGDIAVGVVDEDGSPCPGVTAHIENAETVSYAVPGNSYPGTYTALYLTVVVPAGTRGGLKGLQITSGSQAHTLPGAVYVIEGD